MEKQVMQVMNIISRRTAMAALVMLSALALAACGRKGPLEPHPDDTTSAKTTQNKDRPGGQKFSLGSRNKTLSSPIKPPDRPFILDKLL